MLDSESSSFYSEEDMKIFCKFCQLYNTVNDKAKIFSFELVKDDSHTKDETIVSFLLLHSSMFKSAKSSTTTLPKTIITRNDLPIRVVIIHGDHIFQDVFFNLNASSDKKHLIKSLKFLIAKKELSLRSNALIFWNKFSILEFENIQKSMINSKSTVRASNHQIKCYIENTKKTFLCFCVEKFIHDIFSDNNISHNFRVITPYHLSMLKPIKHLSLNHFNPRFLNSLDKI